MARPSQSELDRYQRLNLAQKRTPVARLMLPMTMYVFAEPCRRGNGHSNVVVSANAEDSKLDVFPVAE